MSPKATTPEALPFKPSDTALRVEEVARGFMPTLMAHAGGGAIQDCTALDDILEWCGGLEPFAERIFWEIFEHTTPKPGGVGGSRMKKDYCRIADELQKSSMVGGDYSSLGVLLCKIAGITVFRDIVNARQVDNTK